MQKSRMRSTEDAEGEQLPPPCAPSAGGGGDGGDCLTPEMRRQVDAHLPHCRGEPECVAAASVSLPARLRDSVMRRYRPPMPAEWRRKPDAWLSNFDIAAVMVQHAEARPDFEFLGVFPGDFFCVKNGAPVSEACVPAADGASCRLDGRRFAGKTCAALVMNLDDHDRPGSHWVAVYVRLSPAGREAAYYYDPAGKPPDSRLEGFWRQLAALAPACVEHSRYNDRAHQRQNSECGMFSLMFVEAMLRGADFDAYCAAGPTDADAHRLRRSFFLRR